MAVGAPEVLVLLVVFVIVLAPLGLVIWNVVDVAQRSEADFAAAGQNRTTWLVLPLVLMAIGIGWLVSIYYLVSVRRRVEAAAPSSP